MSAIPDTVARAIRYTIFPNTSASRKLECAERWSELVARIKSPKEAPEKSALPLISMGRYGDKRTDRNALRHRDNLQSISGLEGDYDGETVPMEDAAERIGLAGIRAVLYTSPSHTPEKPRWRILAPLSREHPPAERARFVGRINGILGGILSGESFTPSQSFYVGKVAGREYASIAIDGDYIDARDEFDASAILPKGKATTGGGGSDATTDDEHRDNIRTGRSFHESLRALAARFIGRGLSREDATAVLHGLMEESAERGSARWKGRWDEIPRLIESAAAKYHDPRSGTRAATRGDGAQDETLRFIPADSITPEPIRWLWRGWVARGKKHVLAGAPGTGKTTIAISLAAVVTRGGTLPDGTRAPAGNVVIWSGEDDPKDVLVPRLTAAGADLARVYFVGDVTASDGEVRAFDPARDVALLEDRIVQIGGAALAIVDPVVNAVAGDSHKNGEVRRALAPLVELAQRHDVAVLGISHFSKGTAGREPLERVTGSLAFGALARIVLVAAKAKQGDDEPTTQRLFARAKSNIGPDDGGFAYRIEFGPLPGDRRIETSWVVWGDPVDGSARELLAELEPADDDDGSAIDDAVDFLRDLLANESRPVADIKRAAGAAGHAWRTVQRAKDKLRIKPIKAGMSEGWRWGPAPEGSQARGKLATFEGSQKMSKMPNSQSGHLRGDLATFGDDDGWEPVE